MLQGTKVSAINTKGSKWCRHFRSISSPKLNFSPHTPNFDLQPFESAAEFFQIQKTQNVGCDRERGRPRACRECGVSCVCVRVPGVDRGWAWAGGGAASASAPRRRLPGVSVRMRQRPGEHHPVSEWVPSVRQPPTLISPSSLFLFSLSTKVCSQPTLYSLFIFVLPHCSSFGLECVFECDLFFRLGPGNYFMSDTRYSRSGSSFAKRQNLRWFLPRTTLGAAYAFICYSYVWWNWCELYNDENGVLLMWAFYWKQFEIQGIIWKAMDIFLSRIKECESNIWK